MKFKFLDKVNVIGHKFYGNATGTVINFYEYESNDGCIIYTYEVQLETHYFKSFKINLLECFLEKIDNK